MQCFFINTEVMMDDAAFDLGIVSYKNPQYGFFERVNMQLFGNLCRYQDLGKNNNPTNLSYHTFSNTLRTLNSYNSFFHNGKVMVEYGEDELELTHQQYYDLKRYIDFVKNNNSYFEDFCSMYIYRPDPEFDIFINSPIESYRTFDYIDALTGIEFENLCKKILQKMDFKVESTKATGDGGIDLFAYSSRPFMQGKYIVQCKRYKGSVGEPILRDLYGVVMSENANKGILMTTGTFTQNAKKFANDKQLELIDGAQLRKLLESIM